MCVGEGCGVRVGWSTVGVRGREMRVYGMLW